MDKSRWMLGIVVLMVAAAGCGVGGGSEARSPGTEPTSSTVAGGTDEGLIAFETADKDTSSHEGDGGSKTADRNHIALLDPATTEVVDVPGSQQGLMPALSPDGSKLAFAVRPEDPDEQWPLMVYDVKAKTTKQVGTGASPTWSPDGGSLLVQGGRRINVRTKDVEQLSDTRPGKRTELPDGRMILTSNSATIELLDGSSATPLVVSPGCRLNTASLSPDHEQIAYSQAWCAADDNNGLFVIDIDGTNKRKILDGFTLGTGWSPDGSTIVTAHSIGAGQVDLWTADPAGKATPKRLLTGPASDPTWGPAPAA
jgi:Tol biopolymer transport system component